MNRRPKLPTHGGSGCSGSAWVISAVPQPLVWLAGLFPSSEHAGLRVAGKTEATLVRNGEHIITFLSTDLSVEQKSCSDQRGRGRVAPRVRRAAARALTGALLSRSVTDEYRMKGVEKVKYLSADEGGVDGSDSSVRASLASLMAVFIIRRWILTLVSPAGKKRTAR